MIKFGPDEQIKSCLRTIEYYEKLIAGSSSEKVKLWEIYLNSKKFELEQLKVEHPEWFV